MQSYQHSRPAVLNVSDDEPLHHEGLHHHRSLPWKTAVMLACIFVGMLAVLNSNNSTSTSYLAANMSDGPPKPETFDYEKIKEQGGEYDWKKCKESSDPDCWKKEGERVGGFWSNFGSKMKSYWANLFGHKEKVAEADTSTKPLDDSAATAAPALPTETEAPAPPASDLTPPEKRHKHHSSEAAP